jgi:hypothetical protein
MEEKLLRFFKILLEYQMNRWGMFFEEEFGNFSVEYNIQSPVEIVPYGIRIKMTTDQAGLIADIIGSYFKGKVEWKYFNSKDIMILVDNDSIETMKSLIDLDEESLKLWFELN